MRPLLPFIIVLIVGFLSLSGKTYAQSTYSMDRYALDGDRVNTLTIEFRNPSFAFNRVVIDMSYPEMAAAIEKITVNIGNTESDLWLTADSVLFFSARDQLTAWIGRSAQKINVAFFRNILPGETVKIFLSLRLGRETRWNEDKFNAIVPFVITAHHSEQPERQIRFLPAMNMTIKP